MKNISLIIALCFAFTLNMSATEQSNSSSIEETTISILRLKTVTFKVHGNCGMCKSKIEGSLKGVKGVASASWNEEKLMMTVTYNPKKIDLDDIHNKIAAVGYDTEKVKAKTEVYNKLHGCCKYDRPEN
jgi:copper chaperone CopZ